MGRRVKQAMGLTVRNSRSAVAEKGARAITMTLVYGILISHAGLITLVSPESSYFCGDFDLGALRTDDELLQE